MEVRELKMVGNPCLLVREIPNNIFDLNCIYWIFLTADASTGSHSSSHHHHKFIPYRDSVLTWLLKDSLGGNSKTIMIASKKLFVSWFYQYYCSVICFPSRSQTTPCSWALHECLVLFNPLTPKISLVVLLTVCCMVLAMLVSRIWYWIN